jgi:hypothetical protein
MATSVVTWVIDNTTSTASVKVRYRLSGSSVWTSVSLAASGTTYSVSISNNYLYDFQVVNVNNNDNPSSAISQSIGFTDPNPLLSPTNTTVAYSFTNLSSDIDTYTCTVAAFDSPGSIIATHILTPLAITTDTFAGLQPLTKYYLTITPAANQFTRTFTYIFTTEEVAVCGAPSGSIAVLS